MAAVDPGAYAPPVHNPLGAIGEHHPHPRTGLIESIHAALAHPKVGAAEKATYGKLLASVLAEQAKAHATEQQANTGATASPQNGALPSGQQTDGTAGVLPPNWAQIAAGNPPPPMFGEHIAQLLAGSGLVRAQQTDPFGQHVAALLGHGPAY